ncbi:dephospho-CoA kinase/protein folding accessory domain-containing protein [Rubripirellula obstinata]|uniref:Dephospho-CoA kinase/protein folding accessory domain-containing protein n=1 Tax=Rubripirellula obstinata TaxID=406547 RepID=A0A5B1CHS4_9BACT|nr:GrpB family protein [Rubripirellula obstinata]KAA1260738.1 dephospho-CoA kinase/protein folding accessory domain-containing protein [Rubripirellula obstinata]
MSNDNVRLMHYDPRWRQEFEQTRSSIFFSCEGWITAAHHIGSTAISGLIARPTIDVIAIAVPEDSSEDSSEDGSGEVSGSDRALTEAANRIEGLNFRVVESPLWADGAITLVKPRLTDAEAADATHRIFLVQEDSAILRRAVALRDYLRQHPEIAITLEEIKVAAWKNAEGDLDEYQRNKSVFFAKVQDAM